MKIKIPPFKTGTRVSATSAGSPNPGPWNKNVPKLADI